jgi:hypothetical protein
VSAVNWRAAVAVLAILGFYNFIPVAWLCHGRNLAHPSGDSALHILRTDLATVHSPTEKGFSEPISVEYIREPPLFDPEPGFPQTRAMIAAFRQALLHARPPKVVVLSTIGADAERPNLLNGLRFLEEALADVDLPISFLRAAWFMENAEWDIP